MYVILNLGQKNGSKLTITLRKVEEEEQFDEDLSSIQSPIFFLSLPAPGL